MNCMTDHPGENGLTVLQHWRALPPPLFILAPPRSFTSLMCAMIGQHPQMYGLPETHLLCFQTMTERAAYEANATYPMGHGLLRAVAQLYFRAQTEASVRKAKRWLEQRSDLSTEFLFSVLLDRVFPQIAVDKSPSMVSPETMRRIYKNFPQARFIHLLRHPRGHAESVVKYIHVREKQGPLPPTHWLIRISSHEPPVGPHNGGAKGAPLDPQYGWYAYNKSISEFLKGVPAAQRLTVRGEDLLGDTDDVLGDIAGWMGLRTDEKAIDRMKHPERSPYASFGPRGARYGNDIFFLKNPCLRPSRASEPLSLEGPLGWRKDGQEFCVEVKQMAREFGYE
jgi:hypothetical protein